MEEVILAGKYRILERIVGKFGIRIFLVEDMATGYPALFQGVETKFFPSKDLRERCQTELDISRTLAHFNIPKVLEVIATDEFLGTVVSPFKGKPLEVVLDSGHLYPIPDALKITQQVTSACDTAHLHDLIHGQITPELIWVDDSLRIMVFGLGFSTVLPAYLANPDLAELVLPYLAPEAVRQELLTPSADVFSTGALLYELLTTVPAFAGESSKDILNKLLNEDPPPPRAIDTRIPTGFNTILHTALLKDPTHRYPHAGDFLTALKQKNLTDAIAVAKVVEEYVSSEAEVQAYLDRYAPDDDKRDDQLSAALDEWKQESTSAQTLLEKRKARARRQIVHGHQEGSSLAQEIDQLFEEKKKRTGVLAKLFAPIVKPTPAKILIMTAFLGLIIVLGAWRYNQGDFDPWSWFSTRSSVDNKEVVKERLRREREKRLNTLLHEAVQAFDEGNLFKPEGENALEIYETLAKEYPDEPDVRKGLDAVLTQIRTSGFSALGLKNWRGAKESFIIYLRYFPEDEAVKNQLAYAEKHVARTSAARSEGQVNNGSGAGTGSRPRDITLSGSLLVVSGGKGYLLSLSEGGAPKPLAGFAGGDASASPNGLQVAFTKKSPNIWEVFTLPVTGGEWRQVTQNIYPDRHPAWAPNGYQLVFASKRYTSWDLFRINTDGSGETQLTKTSYDEDWPTLSPDGRRMAYAAKPAGSWQIWISGANGENSSVLTNANGEDTQPTWSPGGEWVAFVSTRNFSPDIWLIHPDGSNLTRLTKALGSEIHPAWSPNGTYLAFINGGGQIQIVTLQGKVKEILTPGLSTPSALYWVR